MVQKTGLRPGRPWHHHRHHRIDDGGANTPELVEAHYGVPMADGVLNAINTRLDADTVAYILEHSDCRVLITDSHFSEVIKRALAKLKNPPVAMVATTLMLTGAIRIRVGCADLELHLRHHRHGARRGPPSAPVCSVLLCGRWIWYLDSLMRVPGAAISHFSIRASDFPVTVHPD